MTRKVIILGKGKVSIGSGSIGPGSHAFIRFDLLPKREKIGTDLLHQNREFLDTVRIEILNLESLEVLQNAVNAARKVLEES